MSDLIISAPTCLSTSAEFIINTNMKNDIVILGVAKTRIRNSKQDPWRNGYMVIYEEAKAKKKAEINEELYNALHLVFTTLSDLDMPNYFVTGDDGHEFMDDG